MTTTTIASANEYKLVSFLMEQRATAAAATAAAAAVAIVVVAVVVVVVVVVGCFNWCRWRSGARWLFLWCTGFGWCT